MKRWTQSSLVGVLIAATLATVTGVIISRFVNIAPSTDRDPSAPIATSDATRVRVGADYYVSVSLIEVSDKDAQGKPWDSMTESGPDLSAEILWKGNRIYRSTTKDDTFVAKWSTGEIHLGQMALSGGTTSLDDLVQAARLNVRSGEEITVRVLDSDVLSHTVIAEKTFTTTNLVRGETIYNFDPPGIIRLALRVNDMGEAIDILK